MKDEILEAVWKAKDALAAKYNHDIHAMFRDMRERAKTSGATYVQLKPRKLKKAGK